MATEDQQGFVVYESNYMISNINWSKLITGMITLEKPWNVIESGSMDLISEHDSMKEALEAVQKYDREGVEDG